jgi:hypothetical protein
VNDPKYSRPSRSETTTSERHHAISTDFTETDDRDVSRSGPEADEAAGPLAGGHSETVIKGERQVDEVDKPIDEVYRKGIIVADRDPDLKASDDDIAQDPVDGTLPRD